MYPESLLPIIIEKYNEFTSVEKTIADFFLENKTKDDFSIKNIKDKIFVSEASLSRFARKCGFKGYREFVYAYETEFLNIHKKIPTGVKEVLDTYNIYLNQMISLVDEKQIDRLSEYITNSKQVLAVGIGSSGNAALEMKSRFARLGVLIDATDKGDEMRMLSVFQNSDTLLIGISISATKQPVLFALENAKKNGAKTVLITANKEMKCDFIDEKILVVSVKNINGLGIISPQIPILLIIDILYNKFLSSEKYRNMRKNFHKQTLKALKYKEEK